MDVAVAEAHLHDCNAQLPRNTAEASPSELMRYVNSAACDRLSLLGLVAIIYYSVSGGPYGVEDRERRLWHACRVCDMGHCIAEQCAKISCRNYCEGKLTSSCPRQKPAEECAADSSFPTKPKSEDSAADGERGFEETKSSIKRKPAAFCRRNP